MGLGAVGLGTVMSGRQPAEPRHLGEEGSGSGGGGSSIAFAAHEEP